MEANNNNHLRGDKSDIAGQNAYFVVDTSQSQQLSVAIPYRLSILIDGIGSSLGKEDPCKLIFL